MLNKFIFHFVIQGISLFWTLAGTYHVGNSHNENVQIIMNQVRSLRWLSLLQSSLLFLVTSKCIFKQFLRLKNLKNPKLFTQKGEFMTLQWIHPTLNLEEKEVITSDLCWFLRKYIRSKFLPCQCYSRNHLPGGFIHFPKTQLLTKDTTVS